MKKLSLIGFVLSIIVLIFALYIQFVIVPDAGVAEVELDQIIQMNSNEISFSYFEVPGYAEAFSRMEAKVDYSIVLLLASIVPFLLCIVPVFKKNKFALLGVLFSLIAFFIGAAYGTHMFS
jgi:lipoprotein signal peptidase